MEERPDPMVQLLDPPFKKFQLGSWNIPSSTNTHFCRPRALNVALLTPSVPPCCLRIHWSARQNRGTVLERDILNLLARDADCALRRPSHQFPRYIMLNLAPTLYLHALTLTLFALVFGAFYSPCRTLLHLPPASIKSCIWGYAATRPKSPQVWFTLLLLVLTAQTDLVCHISCRGRAAPRQDPRRHREILRLLWRR